MDDATLLARFEDCTLPAEQWTHQAHVRVAYLYLCAHPHDEALRRMREGIQRYNTARQVPVDPHRGYHETLTQTWLALVAATLRHYGAGKDSLDFCRQQPHLLERTLPRLYYTRRLLLSPEAKRSFVEPDIGPLPR
jgi:hypothetical protein